MTNLILSNNFSTISELKKHPMAVLTEAGDNPIAILNRNQLVSYCVSPKLFEQMINLLEDIEFAKTIKSRAHEKIIKVDINDL